MGHYVLCDAKGASVGEGHQVQARGTPPAYIDSWSPSTRTVWVRDTPERGSGGPLVVLSNTLGLWGLKFVWRV